ncbi:STAS-like domain-containing protein [Bacteroides congonensis]
MITFEFATINENLGTRQLGEKVRSQLLNLIRENDKVVLDFSGVSVVSNSFADECLAKMLFTMSLDELKQRTTFRGLNEFARKNIAIAFRRRLNAMASDNKS